MHRLQHLVDAIRHPPATHTYRIEGLQPIGVLQQRWEIINDVAPEFFASANRFLDVGCNRGFFLLQGRAHFDYMMGIDVVPECVDLCRQLLSEGCEYDIRHETFGELSEQTVPFDRIMLGNCPHYIFNEYQGWSWITKLIKLAAKDALVLMECPTGMECREMRKHIPPRLHSEFTEQKFFSWMRTGFDLRGRHPSPSPQRHIMLWQRQRQRYA